MAIERATLLNDLRGWMPRLEADLRARAEQPDIEAGLRADWAAAREKGRTGDDYPAWLDAWLTQVAAAWLLSTLFVRFIEDNDLVESPWLAGPGDRGRLADDRRQLYFRAQPTHSDRDYLLHVFTEARRLPAAGALFADLNPVWRLGPTGDACESLLAFWREIDPATGALRRDFTGMRRDTRFLGDLYQDLSETARKRFALLQTPDFVESYILDRTLDPALAEFGLEGFRLIDPACGSGHFLLGAFTRLLDRWQQAEPGQPPRDLVRRALESVHGVDVNPFAVAISRFRLLVAALDAAGDARLADAPAYPLQVTCADSLLFGSSQLHWGPELVDSTLYRVEDPGEIRRILGERHHAVVANPPYITVKDRTLNRRYRELYPTCHRQYSLGVPFTAFAFG